MKKVEVCFIKPKKRLTAQWKVELANLMEEEITKEIDKEIIDRISAEILKDLNRSGKHGSIIKRT